MNNQQDIQASHSDLLKQKQEVLGVIATRRMRLEKIPIHFHQDEEVIVALMKAWPEQYKSLAPEMQALRSVVIQATAFAQNLAFFPEEFKKDKAVVVACLDGNGNNIQYADPSLKADKEIALYAVQKNPHAYFYIDQSLKADDVIVRATLHGQGLLLEKMPQEIQQNEEYFALAMSRNCACYKWGKQEFKENPQYIQMALKDGNNLQYLPQNIRDDKEIVMKVLTPVYQWNADMHSSYLPHVSERLRDDEEVVELALQGEASFIYCASKRIRALEKFFLKICHNLEAIEYMSEDIKRNETLFIQALEGNLNVQAMKIYHPHLLEDDAILLKCLKKLQQRGQMKVVNDCGILPDKWRERVGTQDPITYIESAIMQASLEASLPQKQRPKKAKL